MRISLFSKDYGKIHTWHFKKSKNFDIWDILEVTIERKWWQNILRDQEKKTSLLWIRWGYEGIINMLGMLQILETMLPEDVPYAHIFDDYKETVESMHQSGEQLSKFHQLLIKIRLLKFLGILNTTNISNPIISYISREITTTGIGKILKARWNEKIALHDLERIIHTSIGIN